jgi:hypothetical protein
MKKFREILEGKGKTETKKFPADKKVKEVWSDNMGIIWASIGGGRMLQLGTVGGGGGWAREVKSWKQKGDEITVKLGPRDLKGRTIT